MSEVHVKEGESLDSALKRFKRSCAKAGVLAEVRKQRVLRAPASSAARSLRLRARTVISVTIDLLVNIPGLAEDVPPPPTAGYFGQRVGGGQGCPPGLLYACQYLRQQSPHSGRVSRPRVMPSCAPRASLRRKVSPSSSRTKRARRPADR